MNKGDKLFWGAIVFVLIICSYAIYLLHSEAGECLQNGFLYGAKNQIKGGEVNCLCTVNSDNSLSKFSFNSTSIEMIREPKSNIIDVSSFNFSS